MCLESGRSRVPHHLSATKSEINLVLLTDLQVVAADVDSGWIVGLHIRREKKKKKKKKARRVARVHQLSRDPEKGGGNSITE